MIQPAPSIDLGLDATRIKDPRDAERQHATVEEILKRMFHPVGNARWELQVLADEVGLGKTFVALSIAYSLLSHMRTGRSEPDLEGCYQKVLVITPQNGALYAKWRREVSEFIKRCVVESARDEAATWFAPVAIDRLDDLAVELRRPGNGARVLVTHMGVFGGGKLVHYDLKRRFLLGALFRFWGTRFRFDARERLLKGAPADWPRDPSSLTILTEREQEILLFTESELLSALERLSRRDDQIERLLEECLAVSEPFTRSRDELFRSIGNRLNGLYRSVATTLIGKDLPLVIVDEAHNWKNGPTMGANGYYSFRDSIARRARRALLLTATPFQLRPDEMLELMKVSDDLAPCPTISASASRCDRLRKHREEAVRPVLESCASAARRFSRAWSRLPSTVRTTDIEGAWSSAALERARSELLEIAAAEGPAAERLVASIVERATLDVDPALREFLREALRVYTYNADLSTEMGPLVIRHRRNTQHRAFRVGGEYGSGWEAAAGRMDGHVLHAAAGLDVRGEGELPHYLLMRCVSEMKNGKGRSSLGSALTGCYSTLLDSAEGKQIQSRLRDSGVGGVYLNLLGELVNERQDAKHPKLREVVDAVIQSWRAGEKTLIFCFRINTAKRLREIIDDQIRKEMTARRKRCLGGEEALKALRGRLTGRDRDLIGLGLDRVLWSAWCATRETAPFDPTHLEFREGDLVSLARVALRHGVDLVGERVDRVFLNRTIEHVLSARILHDLRPKGWWADLLSQIADPSWVTNAYGLGTDAETDEGGVERPDFDERGANSGYPLRQEEPPKGDVDALAARLIERWQRGRLIGENSGVLDGYARGPSLWLGPKPHAPTLVVSGIARALHSHVADLCSLYEGVDWNARRLLFQALRRALLRESVLLRLLPEKADREERQWGDLLAERFFAPLEGQRESMADRVGVFLEDLRAASGSITDEGSARHALFDSTRLKDQQFVALVAGGKDERSRERVFAGFNSPLLPEVLVCTSVGQEGIDLHRHCRHVVHYDLAWNPAVLEQRTGRVDRIGSKTFRERSHGEANGSGPFLEIGVPFLAGTYDERMYGELRLRAQTFEVLTGGDVAADGENREGRDDVAGAEGKSQRVAMVPLPERILRELRVNLHVWSESSEENITTPRGNVQ